MKKSLLSLATLLVASSMLLLALPSLGFSQVDYHANPEKHTLEQLPKIVEQLFSLDDEGHALLRTDDLDDKAFQVDGFWYYIIDGKTDEVALSRQVGRPAKNEPNKYQGDVVVPETIEHEGKTYTVTEIGQSAFFFKSVKTIKYPKTIRKIGSMAFFITDLVEIVIPDHIEEVGSNAYAFCNKALKLEIGKGLKKVGELAFYDCYYLKTITVSPDNTIYSERDNALYSKDQKIIYKYPSFRKNFTSVTFPETVEEVANDAFMYCFYIADWKLNEGLKKIGTEAFKQCYAMKSMTIPSTVEEIADGSTFNMLKSYEKFVVAPGNKHFEVLLDGKLLVNKTKKEAVSVLYQDWDADNNPKKQRKVVIPEGIEKISTMCFGDVKENKSLEVILPQSLKSIGDLAFQNSAIVELRIPEGVTIIPEQCFYGCTNLKLLQLGKEVTEIHRGVLDKAKIFMESSDAKLQVLAPEPPKLAEDPEEGYQVAFDMDVIDNATLQVPKESLDKYKKHDQWKEFKHIVAYDPTDAQVVAPEEQVSLQVDGRVLTVSQEREGLIQVYALDGTLVCEKSASVASFELPRGIYLVVCGGQTLKTIVF